MTGVIGPGLPGTLPAATPVPVLLLDEERFAAVGMDALDVERLVIQRISK